MAELRVLQFNANRSKAAHRLLVAAAVERHADVVLISEPNLALAKQKKWLLDETGGAAIWLSTALVTKKQGRGSGFAWIETESLVIVSCYFSPNEDRTFQAGMSELEDILRSTRKRVLLAGDFNAHHERWNQRSSNGRGEELVDFIDTQNLVVHNDGTPTWRRREQSSVLDLLITTANLAADVTDWKVDDVEMFSDHQLITYAIRDAAIAIQRPRHRFLYRPSRKDKVQGALAKAVSENPCNTPADLDNILQRACEMSLRVAGQRNAKAAVHWWTPEIGELQKRVTRTRRQLKRERRRGGLRCSNDPVLTGLQQQIEESRSHLRAAIISSQNQCWRKLCDQLQSNPWGDAYKMVRDKMAPRNVIPDELRHACISKLFPKRPLFTPPLLPRCEVVQLFTTTELQAAASRVKEGKSPGPDGVPPEVVKMMAKLHPDEMLTAFNAALEEGIFPDEWKRAVLVLLPKPGKPPDDPAGLRPLCLLNTDGKLFEAMLLARLLEHLDSVGGISKEQYGFRKGRSTIAAIRRVTRAAERAAAGTWRTRQIPAVVLLDVTNQRLQLRKVGPHLRNAEAAASPSVPAHCH